MAKGQRLHVARLLLSPTPNRDPKCIQKSERAGGEKVRNIASSIPYRQNSKKAALSGLPSFRSEISTCAAR